MTDAELSEIGLRHFDDEAQVHGKTHCEGCGHPWPCDTAVALAEVERLRKAIQTVLDDNETGAGGWGPDVTMAEVLRVAMEGGS